MYSNESERANEDIYNDFKLKKPFGLHGLLNNISAFEGFTQNSRMTYVTRGRISWPLQNPFDRRRRLNTGWTLGQRSTSIKPASGYPSGDSSQRNPL